MLREEVPDPLAIVGGVKVGEAPAGNPVTLKLTVPLKPPEGVDITV